MRLGRLCVGLMAFLSAGAAAAAGSDGTKVLGAIGDSITTGFDAQHFGDNRELSWSTGDSPLINSHLHRREALLDTHITARNEAVAGSVAATLEGQIT